MKFVDRLKFSATGTSAASITVIAALAGCRALVQAIADGALLVGDTSVPFTITDGTAWEDSLFTVTSSTVITRTQVLASSAGGTAAATFSGPLTVFNTVPGAILSRVAFDSDVAFSQTVPLTQIGTAWMPPKLVTGPLTFSPMAGAVKGAFATVRLIADGTNAPVFAGFTESIGSAGYDNRQGIVNVIQFMYDGYDYWFAASQSLNAVPVDVVAPTAASAQVANATPATLTITASEALDPNKVPAASAFTVTGHTVMAVNVSGTSVNLTVSSAFSYGEAARTVNYVQPGSNALADIAGNLMASFSSPLAVSNNLLQPASAVTLSLSASSVAVNLPVTATIGTDQPLTGSQSETITLTAPVAGSWSPSNSVTLNAATASATATFTPTATGSGNVTAAAAGTPTLSSGSAALTIIAADTTAPTFTSAQVADASPTVIQVTMSETLAASTPPASAFTVSGGKTVSSVSISGRIVSLTCSAAYKNGDAITVAYTAPGGNPRLQDPSANITTSFGAQAVTNNVAPATLRFAQLAAMTESGTSPNYAYAGQGAASNFNNPIGGIATMVAPATGDCSMAVTLGNYNVLNDSPGDELIFGIRNTNTVGTYSTINCSLFAQIATGKYNPLTNGSGSNVTQFVAPTNGDIVRMRVDRTNNQIVGEVARAGTPTTFLQVCTWAIPTGTLYFQLALGGLATASNLTGVSLV